MFLLRNKKTINTFLLKKCTLSVAMISQRFSFHGTDPLPSRATTCFLAGLSAASVFTEDILNSDCEELFSSLDGTGEGR